MNIVKKKLKARIATLRQCCLCECVCVCVSVGV